MIHRDQWAYDFFPFPKGYEVQCNTIWAMTDFTEENGATRVIPGSNHFDDRLSSPRPTPSPPRWRRDRCSSTPGSVYHGGGREPLGRRRATASTSPTTSPGCGRRRTSTSRCPLEIARTLPVDLLRLIGYARGAYALGYVDDLRDPIEVVRPDLGTSGLGDLAASTKALRRQANRSRE